MDTVHPGFRNFEVTLWKNRLQGGSILRENGVRNEESTRKHGCGAHAICSQCFIGKEGENWGRRKGDVASKEACGLVAKLQQAASRVPAEPESPLCLTYSFFTKACLLMVSTTSLKRIFEVSV